MVQEYFSSVITFISPSMKLIVPPSSPPPSPSAAASILPDHPFSGQVSSPVVASHLMFIPEVSSQTTLASTSSKRAAVMVMSPAALSKCTFEPNTMPKSFEAAAAPGSPDPATSPLYSNTVVVTVTVSPPPPPPPGTGGGAGAGGGGGGGFLARASLTSDSSDAILAVMACSDSSAYSSALFTPAAALEATHGSTAKFAQMPTAIGTCSLGSAPAPLAKAAAASFESATAAGIATPPGFATRTRLPPTSTCRVGPSAASRRAASSTILARSATDGGRLGLVASLRSDFTFWRLSANKATLVRAATSLGSVEIARVRSSPRAPSAAPRAAGTWRVANSSTVRAELHPTPSASAAAVLGAVATETPPGCITRAGSPSTMNSMVSPPTGSVRFTVSADLSEISCIFFQTVPSGHRTELVRSFIVLLPRIAASRTSALPIWPLKNTLEAPRSVAARCLDSPFVGCTTSSASPSGDTLTTATRSLGPPLAAAAAEEDFASASSASSELETTFQVPIRKSAPSAGGFFLALRCPAFPGSVLVVTPFLTLFFAPAPMSLWHT
mmetsp:Transcript_55736/g.126631  ORF Transcript_55736/g.126631 Transcript_55736/m.126631 type:complete len:555 (-) Transcript_55736:1329-2993(-)